MGRWTVIFLLSLLPVVLPVAAQSPAMMFYNVESLYDTVPALFHDDDYTPEGRYRWDSERYTAKLQSLASVIDAVSADLVALAEVENEAVVRDLVMTLGTDYNYIHRTSNDSRGIDLALLYKGDRFFVDRVEDVESGFGRQFMYVRGRLQGVGRIDLVVCHLPSQIGPAERRERAMHRLASFVDELHRTDSSARIVVAGDFNSSPAQRTVRRIMPRFLFPLLLEAERRGEGTTAYDGRWQMLDHFWVERTKFPDVRAQVYIVENLLEGFEDGQVRPRRTFRSGAYTGGASDHLPIILIFRS